VVGCRRGEEPIDLADWNDWGELSGETCSDAADERAALLVSILSVFIDESWAHIGHSAPLSKRVG